MFKNSQIKNVIVNNGEISIKSIIILTSNRITLNNNSSQAFIGGIAGYATNSATSDSDPGESSRYKIENCYSTTDIRTNFYPKKSKCCSTWSWWNYWWNKKSTCLATKLFI